MLLTGWLADELLTHLTKGRVPERCVVWGGAVRRGSLCTPLKTLLLLMSPDVFTTTKIADWHASLWRSAAGLGAVLCGCHTHASLALCTAEGRWLAPRPVHSHRGGGVLPLGQSLP